MALRLVAESRLDGLRIDHVDGLKNPSKYLHDLREARSPRSYIVVEKILAADEDLPNWPVQGPPATTGSTEPWMSLSIPMVRNR